MTFQELSIETLQVADRNGAVIVTFDQPRKMNAFSRAMLAALEQVVEEMIAGKARALILTGTGDKAFCAGSDLSEAPSMSKAEASDKNDRARAVCQRIATANFISVAAVNGLALGGGLELASACTFRVASPNATFSLPEIKIGVMPTYGGTQRLPALVGKTRALDLMLTGRTIDCQEALNWGLVDRVTDDETSALQGAENLVGEILGFSQVSIDAVRRCVAAAGPEVKEEGLRVEGIAAREVSSSYDAGEGVRAFLEKRAPKFEHR